jgi:hypothetical protein
LFICQTIVFIIIKNITMTKEKATEVKGCKQCQKGLSTTQKGLVVLSMYILGTSIFGTIELIKYLAELLK